ncbi:MAG: hypothetical protein Q8M03_03010 [Legionella sp.]|nr:hypothetical protein [Legionella sp.]
MSIQYWHGIYGDEELLKKHHKTLDKLLACNYKSAGLDAKHLKNDRPFTVRINDSDRLLFTSFIVDGKPYLLLLEDILNHDYQKSRFLKPGVLQNYLELHKDEITQKIRNGEKVILSNPEPDTEKEANPESDTEEFQESDFDYPVKYGQQYIVLNTEQQEALAAPLPVVVSGAPGSGKSCVAISLLEQCQENQAKTEELRPLLYVTQSEELVKGMQSIWTNLAKDEGLPEVQFKTFQQLMEEIANDPADKRKLVDDADFKIWLQEHISNQHSLRKVKPKDFPAADFFNQKDLIYQEFRLMSGLSPEDYRKLGGKQCHFLAKIEKKWLLNAYSTYQDYLNKNKQLHPSFPLNKTGFYSTIVVDEAQDLSTGQLQNLLQLSTNSQICYLMDSHQSLLDELSQRSLLIRWVRNHITLPFSYRCPPNITDIANGVIKIKTDLTGGLTDKYEVPEIQPSPHHEEAGSVRWYNKISEEEKAYVVNATRSTAVAIVTPAEHIEEARKLFPTADLILTPEDIKGLEYPIIIAYRPFDTPIFKEANAILDKKIKRQIIVESQGSSSSGHRAKKGQRDDKFGPPFNKTFTAFTRAINELIIFQESSHDNKHIVNTLQQKVNKQAALADLSNTPTPIASSKAEWEQEAEKQERAGNVEQANAIRERWGITTPPQNKSEETHLAETKAQPKAQESNRRRRGKNTAGGKGAPKAQPNKEASSSSTPQKKTLPVPQQMPVIPKTAPKEHVKTAQVKKEDLEFVEKLLKNFNEANLKGVFAPKIKRPEKWFFDVPVQNHPFLLSAILDDEKKITRLWNFLSNNERALTVSADKLLPLFPKLCLNEAGQQLLALLLNDNPLLVPSISEKDLCHLRDYPGIHEVTSPLFWLSKTEIGRLILSTYLANNPQLALKISAKDLCHYRSEKGEADENTSPFYWLAESPCGLMLLQHLIDMNPDLAIEITADSLCRQRTAKAGASEGSSVLFLLAGTLEGTEILQKLLEANPKLAQGITAQALYSIRPKDGSNNTNKSAFDNLLGFPQGRNIINYLLKNNQELVKEITGNTLCRMDLTFFNGEETIPPLHWLTTTDEGQEIFATLLAKKPALAQEITHEALCHPRSHLAGVSENVSPLYGLSTSSAGVKILHQLLVNNPVLAKAITAEELCRFKTFPGSYQNASPLYWLTADNLGRDVLNLLLETNPELAKQIPAEALCRSLTNEAGSRANTCPLLALSVYDNGIKFLRTLLTNPGIAEGITGEALCRLRTDKAGRHKNTSVLYGLSASENGRAFLSELLAKNPGLSKEITAETLYIRRVPEAGEYQNLSVFYHLTSSDTGLAILETLLRDNPQLVEKITPEDLCAFRNEKAGESENYSPLLLLCKTAKGREILKFLLVQKPDLAQGITKEALERVTYVIDPLDGSKATSRSAKLSLLQSDNGQEILDLLPSIRNQKMAHSCSFFMKQGQKPGEKPDDEKYIAPGSEV